MSKIQMSQTKSLEFLKFEFKICFGFRYSDFGFYSPANLEDGGKDENYQIPRWVNR